jgi:hypothetical protein
VLKRRLYYKKMFIVPFSHLFKIFFTQMYHNCNILKCDGSYLAELLDLEGLIKFSVFLFFLGNALQVILKEVEPIKWLVYK